MKMTRLAPEFLKAPIRDYLRHSAIKKALLQIRGGITDENVERFYKAWGNEGFSADLDYLRQLVTLLQKCNGPVLECGTGGTTLLSNEVGLARGFKSYCLEQDAAWVAEMKATMADSPSATEILFAPLGKAVDHCFYETREWLPNHFALIICDGPYIDKALGEPWFSGWRYGVLPWLKRTGRTWDKLLLDDMNDQRAEAVVSRWVKDFGVGVKRIKSVNGECAIVTAA